MDGMIYALFDKKNNANKAIKELKSKKYNPKDISIITKETNEIKVKGEESKIEHVEKDALAGAGTGAVIGALAGILIGVGAISVPGIGGLLVAGPVASALGLTGAAAATVSGTITGVLAGGLLGALIGLGVPEEHAKIYEQRIREGAILLSIPVNENQAEGVRKILENSGASDITLVSMQ
ncbi:hypothetical protein C4559_04635 [Candidatus Microgenomates bacterium]|nr:MAG: hypothetical protein C4559_04635 [Candidatus Microgenomates bacterium]